MKQENAFVRLSNVERAQELADGFERVDWIRLLGRYALRINPACTASRTATCKRSWGVPRTR